MSPGLWLAQTLSRQSLSPPTETGSHVDRDRFVFVAVALLPAVPSDRLAGTMPANQLRMWFSAMAYVLIDSLRRVVLRHTQFADAPVATIRLKLLKLGAQVRSSVRRLHFALASGCPNKIEFEMAYLYLRRAFNSS